MKTASTFKLLRTLTFVLILVLAVLGAGWSQQQNVVRVQVSADVPGAVIYVDGQPYPAPMNFFWNAGTKHVLATERVQETARSKTRYRFLKWGSDKEIATPLEERIEVLAGPGAAAYQANFATEYAISLVLFRCEPYFQGCTQPGTVAVNGKVYDYSTDVYVPAGVSAALRAIPGSNYVFGGWGALPGVATQNAAISLVVNAPVLAAPVFKPTSGVTFQIFTEPPGLKIMADGVELQTPTSLSWPWFTEHVISAASPQRDPRDPEGKLWVFQNWSDGGAATHTVTVRGGLWPDSFTAKFVRATEAELSTVPPGLALKVDGQECRPCRFVWGLGESHTIVAADQMDSQKLSYTFDKWSNEGFNPQQVTVDSVRNSIRMAAIFKRQGLLTVESVPRGIRMKIADGECNTPCQIQKPLGAPITLRAPASHFDGRGNRLDFVHWWDSDDTGRVLTATADPQTVTAEYRIMNPLTVLVDPVDGGTVKLEPVSTDGFYDKDTRVALTVVPRPGYRFHHWEGDMTGAVPAAHLGMGGPRQVTARLDAVPYLPDDSVRSAAAETHGTDVAPCSVASIVGVNLALREEKGSEQPLQQFIGGVSARVGETLMPLFYVSPTEIRAQVPCGLAEGRKILTVEVGDKPKASTEFNVTRNAPGLFGNRLGDRVYAVAAHADGRPLSPEDPAKAGEVVTVYGTGLGPLMSMPLDGFAVNESPGYRLADSLEVLVGDDGSAQAIYAGGAAQGPGVQGVRFRVADHDASFAIRVRVNGRESNSVLLPLSSVR